MGEHWIEVTTHYRYRRSPSSAWTSSRWAGRVRQPLETLVLQALRQRKAGYEIEITSIDWCA